MRRSLVDSLSRFGDLDFGVGFEPEECTQNRLVFSSVFSSLFETANLGVSFEPKQHNQKCLVFGCVFLVSSRL